MGLLLAVTRPAVYGLVLPACPELRLSPPAGWHRAADACTWFCVQVYHPHLSPGCHQQAGAGLRLLACPCQGTHVDDCCTTCT